MANSPHSQGSPRPARYKAAAPPYRRSIDLIGPQSTPWGILLTADLRTMNLRCYTAYILGHDGSITHSVNLVCDGEEAAIECAKALLDRFPVELWDADRLIIEFKPANY